MAFEGSNWIEWILKPGIGAVLGLAAKYAWDRCAGRLMQKRLQGVLADIAPLLCETFALDQAASLVAQLSSIEKRYNRTLALSRNILLHEDILAATSLLRPAERSSAGETARKLEQVREIGERLRVAGSGL